MLFFIEWYFKMSTTSAFSLALNAFSSILDYLNNCDLICFVLRYHPDFSHNSPVAGQIVPAASSEFGVTLTIRDCYHQRGGGQPVPPTLDFSGGSSRSRS